MIFLTQLTALLFLAAFPEAGRADDSPSTSGVNFVPQVTIGQDSEANFTKGTAVPVDGNTVGQYIRLIYKYAIGVIGILATIVMMIGGVLWLTAGGNQTRVSEAQEWIKASITGLALALASYLILATVNPALTTFKSLDIQKISQYNFKCCVTQLLVSDQNGNGVTDYECADVHTDTDQANCRGNIQNQSCSSLIECQGRTNGQNQPAAPLGTCDTQGLCPSSQYCVNGNCYNGSAYSPCKDPVNSLGQCKNGSCVMGIGSTGVGICSPGDPGSVCCSNSDCKSGKCTRDTNLDCTESDVKNAIYVCK